jgi:hypothetical protein
LGSIDFLDTFFQLHHQLRRRKVIRFGNVLKRAEPLQQAPDAIGLLTAEYRKRLWPLLQDCLNRELGVENLCVHDPKDTTVLHFPLCATANKPNQKSTLDRVP